MQDTAGEARTNLLVTFFYGNSTHACARVDRPERTYLYQLCADTGYNLEDLS